MYVFKEGISSLGRLVAAAWTLQELSQRAKPLLAKPNCISICYKFLDVSDFK